MENNSSHLVWTHCCIPKIMHQNKDFMSIKFSTHNIKELVLGMLYTTKYMWILLFQGEGCQKDKLFKIILLIKCINNSNKVTSLS